MITAYKLVRLRKDGTLGSLFMNASARLPVGEFIRARPHARKGFAYRPGWHTVAKPVAPHLSKKGRVWVKVWISEYQQHRRPAHQGGLWFTSNFMYIREVLG